ncbi:NUDIX hydrolase [Corynebacterium sp. SCR221107]|uniref:NUDIX domain-containing protein n=1 Tax=Corynebacterium sp. SCR221107 TaxID=3017361 RepID=UPI0022EC877D|nr:NUDIX hydrolase [Corynebacterium sp. SCR221107]WBT09942.1 NUDIX hydrolase [Corynebacterium sp. SCR221107]
MAFDFRAVSSELLVDAPILAVRRDIVTMPGGGTAPREIVEHFGAVAVVAFDGENIALVHQYRRSVGQRLYELPAGLLDVANEDPLDCAQRELREEAGVKAQQWQLLVDLVTSPGFCDESVRVYLAQQLSETPRPEAEEEEADLTLHWVPLPQAVDMVMTGKVYNSIAIAGIMTAAQALASAQVRSVEEPFEIRPTALSSRRQAEGLSGDMKKKPGRSPR